MNPDLCWSTKQTSSLLQVRGDPHWWISVLTLFHVVILVELPNLFIAHVGITDCKYSFVEKKYILIYIFIFVVLKARQFNNNRINYSVTGDSKQSREQWFHIFGLLFKVKNNLYCTMLTHIIPLRKHYL